MHLFGRAALVPRRQMLPDICFRRLHQKNQTQRLMDGAHVLSQIRVVAQQALQHFRRDTDGVLPFPIVAPATAIAAPLHPPSPPHCRLTCGAVVGDAPLRPLPVAVARIMSQCDTESGAVILNTYGPFRTERGAMVAPAGAHKSTSTREQGSSAMLQYQGEDWRHDVCLQMLWHALLYPSTSDVSYQDACMCVLRLSPMHCPTCGCIQAMSHTASHHKCACANQVC